MSRLREIQRSPLFSRGHNIVPNLLFSQEIWGFGIWILGLNILTRTPTFLVSPRLFLKNKRCESSFLFVPATSTLQERHHNTHLHAHSFTRMLGAWVGNGQSSTTLSALLSINLSMQAQIASLEFLQRQHGKRPPAEALPDRPPTRSRYHSTPTQARGQLPPCVFHSSPPTGDTRPHVSGQSPMRDVPPLVSGHLPERVAPGHLPVRAAPGHLPKRAAPGHLPRAFARACRTRALALARCGRPLVPKWAVAHA